MGNWWGTNGELMGEYVLVCVLHWIILPHCVLCSSGHLNWGIYQGKCDLWVKDASLYGLDHFEDGGGVGHVTPFNCVQDIFA